MPRDKKCKHSRRKSSMRKCKTPKHKTLRIRKMRGGVSFNDSLATSSLFHPDFCLTWLAEKTVSMFHDAIGQSGLVGDARPQCVAGR